MDHLARSGNLLTLLGERLAPDDGADPDPLLESVVVNYLLTTIYADLELGVHAILVAYGNGGTNDPRVQTFVESAVKRIVRSIKCTELAGVLGMFHTSCKKHFQEAVNDTPRQVAYDRVVSARHDQSHSLGSDLTLKEVAADIGHCNAVLEDFATALECDCHPLEQPAVE